MGLHVRGQHVDRAELGKPQLRAQGGHARPIDVGPQVVPVPMIRGGAIALGRAAIHQQRVAFAKRYLLATLPHDALAAKRIENDVAILVGARRGEVLARVESAYLAAPEGQRLLK